MNAITLAVACKICWGIYFIIKFAPTIRTKLTISAATKARITGIWNSGKLA